MIYSYLSSNFLLVVYNGWMINKVNIDLLKEDFHVSTIFTANSIM
jgi:hypothetical protein